MTDPSDPTKYDEVLSSILVNEKSIIGFLSTVFGFLARRTDFYYVSKGPYENLGFLPGVAEELVLKVLRTCDPKTWDDPNGGQKPPDINNEIMCSTVAQEVEVETENDDCGEEVTETQFGDTNPAETSVPESDQSQPSSSTNSETTVSKGSQSDIDDRPPLLPTQKNSETYNGAERENYCWSQTITELEVTVKLPSDIKTSKDLKVIINTGDICVSRRNGEIILKNKLAYKIKTVDSFWSISERKLLIHLEKIQERWWTHLLEGENPIDLSRIDCSRSLYELPDDHIAKVHEMQWNQEQKFKGLPTSDQIRNIEILKKAWNADGSPFKGQEFDPNVILNQNKTE